MMISLHCHHQAAGFRLHRSLVEMKGERGRLETLVGMRGVSLMWNAFRRYRYCYCSSPLLPPCLSVSVCVWVWVCLSVSLWVVVVQRTWRQAQSGPSATSQGTVCTVYWVPAGYICFSLSFFQSHSFSLPHCFVLSFFFFFCKHISPSLSVCRVQILQTGIIPCLLQGLWLSLCWSCLRSKIFLHWKAVV